MSKRKKENDEDDISVGLALGLALIIVSGYLYLNPDYFRNEWVSYTIGIFVGVIGIVGFFHEISKVIKEDFKKELSDTLIALVLISGLLILYKYIVDLSSINNLSHYSINSVFFLFFTICLFGFLKELFSLIKVIFDEKNIKGIIAKASLTILNFFIFILTILQLLKLLKIID